MGKRKSRKAKAVGVKKTKGMQKLDTQFQCPFCGHGTSVECRIDKKIQIGEAFCWNCLERFCTQIHALTEPIDIYADWIDECERANNSWLIISIHSSIMIRLPNISESDAWWLVHACYRLNIRFIFYRIFVNHVKISINKVNLFFSTTSRSHLLCRNCVSLIVNGWRRINWK